MPLVVVHRNNNVIPSSSGLGEYRVRWNRTIRVYSLCLCLFDGRNDLVDLLPAEQAVLSAVRIEPGDTDARLFDPQIPAGLPGYADHFQYSVFFNAVTGLTQGDMRGDVHNP